MLNKTPSDHEALLAEGLERKKIRQEAKIARRALQTKSPTPYRTVAQANKHRGKPWSDQKRLEVVQSYILVGSLRQASSLNGIPFETARIWKTQQWWKDLEDELRRGSKLKLTSRLSSIVDKSMVALEDRIENGDFDKVYDKETKTWEFRRRPINAETAQKITAQLVDRMLHVEKSATEVRITSEGVDDILKKLAIDMANFAKRKPQGEIIDVIPIEPLQLPEECFPEETSPSANHLSDSTPTGPRPLAASPDDDGTTSPSDPGSRVTLAYGDN